MMKIATFLFASLIAITGSLQAQEKMTGNGNMKKEKRAASGAFDEISSSGKFNIYIKQGSTPSIEVEADENLLPYIETEIRGEELHLHPKKGYNINPSKHITVWVTVAELHEVSASGQVGLFSEGVIKGGTLEVSCSGKVESKLDLQYEKLEISMSGSGRLNLNGRADKAEIHVSGSGEIEAPDMQSDVMEIAISGSGNASVNVSKKLEIAISGSGNVKYKGAASVEQSVSGRGKVSHQN